MCLRFARNPLLRSPSSPPDRSHQAGCDYHHLVVASSRDTPTGIFSPGLKLSAAAWERLGAPPDLLSYITDGVSVLHQALSLLRRHSVRSQPGIKIASHQYDGVADGVALLSPTSYMAMIDIADAFLTVSMHQSAADLLGFRAPNVNISVFATCVSAPNKHPTS